MWKKGQATWEKYRSVFRACRDMTKEAKVHLELNLARDVSDKFSSTTSVAKQRIRKMWLSAEWGGCPSDKESGLLNSFLASTFTAKSGLQEPQTLEARESWRKEDFPLIKKGWVCRSYRQTWQPWQDAPASVEGVGRCYCQAILHHFWKVMESRKAACRSEENQCHFCIQKWQEGELRKLQASQSHFHPWKGDRTAYPGCHLHGEKKEVMRSSGHGFTKWKTCLTNLIDL